MQKLKSLVCISSLALVFVVSAAQNHPSKKPVTRRDLTPQAKAQIDKDVAPAAKMALPTTAEVDAYMKRSFGYDPGVTWQILDIHESSAPGIAEVIVSVNKGEPYHLFLIPTAQTALAGQMIPFGPNPYAAARAKLQGAFGPSRGGENNPKIDVVEFSYLQCPHCKPAQPIVENLAG